jgi:hypothetical protein
MLSVAGHLTLTRAIRAGASLSLRRGLCTVASLVPLYLRLVVQDRAQERIMNLDLSVVRNEAELAKPVHEKADTGACCKASGREQE